MKKLSLSFVILLSTVFAFAQGGWRQNEMQVRVELSSADQLHQLQQLKLNGDIYSDHAVVYVMPKELKVLANTGLNFEIQVKNLNEHYQDFWLSEDAYHTYDEIVALADSLVGAFPNLCEKHMYGTSLQGRELAALKISDNVSTDEPEAEVMFDGGIHGDEIGAAENVIRFARDILINYGSDPNITSLIDNREIWLYYMVNPDGRVNMSRYNASGVDLNRDWGYMWDGWGSSSGAYSQPESKALRECMYNNQFVVHTTYHSGTEYISCPWSYRSDQCPDFDHIYQLAGVYSSVSGYSNLDYGQGNSGMYAINGSTKDGNYGTQGAISWSMEISYSKQPPASQIMMYYNRNRPSMLAMIEYAGYGLEGIVTDATTGQPVQAAVLVNDYFPTYTDTDAGDYHKYVLPGTYTIKVVANGYESQTITGVSVTANNSTVTDFQLQPQDGQFVYKFSSSQIPDNNEADEGNTPSVMGAPDNINYSIGKNGWCVLDMQYPIPDGAGNDIMVYEGDSSPEDFTCYASTSMDGPWEELGTGSGTTEFDLAAGGLYEAQFIKLVDDGDGTQTAPDAGFDLDAIAALDQMSGVYLALFEYEIDDSNGNNNGKIDPGETVDLIVTLRNNGTLLAEGVSGMISTTSPFLTIDQNTAGFGNIAQGETAEGTYTVTADAGTPAGQNVQVDLDVTSNNGTYNNDFTMEFTVGQIPILLCDMDGNNNSATVMQTVLDGMGVTAEYSNAFPANPDLYSAIFVFLGIYSDNHELSSSQGQALADFLNNGGKLYMEGGDTWYYDDQTAVHPMFNINATDDGSSDLSTLNGQSGTFTDGFSYSYSGDNNWIDHIEPVSPAFKIFQNQSPSYGTGVAYDEGTYKTIGCSHEFGGLQDGANTKEELMTEYLEFFELTTGDLNAAFIADQTEICEATQVQFTDNSSGDITSWDWTFPGGDPGTSNDQDPVVTYNTAGVYDVMLTVSDGANNNTMTQEDYITVMATPDTPATPEGPAEVDLHYVQTSEYSTSGATGATSYVWMLSPGSAGDISGNGLTGTVNWDMSFQGTAMISVKGMNDCGEGPESMQFEVEVFTSVGASNLSDGAFSIYPNPATDLLNIEFGEKITVEKVSLLSIAGRMVYDAKITPKKSVLKIKTNNLEAGIYFLKITTSEGTKFNKIVIN